MTVAGPGQRSTTSRLRHPALQVVLAVGAVATALVLTVAVRPFLNATPFALMHLAVLVAAALGGGRAGWLAVGLALLGANLWLFAPYGAFSGDPVVLVSLTFSGAVAATLTTLVSGSQRATVLERARRAEVERLSRLFDALSQVNQAIVRSTTEHELFSTVCRVLIERGGFEMAWVGRHDEQTRQILPVAEFGDTDGYLDGVLIFTDTRPEGLGPTGTAFRERRPYICNDIQTDPSTVLWRSAAAARGFRASASLVICQGGKPVATLTVYAAEPHIFRAREVALLEEAAANISAALDRTAAEAKRHLAEQSADRERALVDTVLESAPGVIYLYDEDHRFIRWNESFRSAVGYTDDELKSADPLEFFNEQDAPRVRAAIETVFRDGNSTVEAGLRSRSGTETPYLFTGRRILLNDRPCLVGMGIDITKRVHAEERLRRSEERYHSTLDSIMEGCQLLSFEWRYLYLNDVAARHNRRANHELLGRTMMDCWPGIEHTRPYALIARCMSERTALREENEFVYPGGSTAWFELRVQPVPEGVFVLSIDVTDRVLAKQALREATADLEQKVLDRTSELQSALVRAESADRLKSAFLATMSHELRTPLNSIIGFTGMLLQGLPGPLNPEQSKQLGMVRGSARHLLELINDVLDISKIEAGQLEVRASPFALHDAVDRVVASVRPLADQKGLRIEVPPAGAFPMINSDRRRVEQVLINLLNNAVKFTESGHVRLTVDSGPAVRLATGKPAVLLEVSDSGIGIRAGDLSSLFQPFRQLDAGLSRQHEGTGLGLAISRRLVELLGGEIRAASEWGTGSSFSVHLPLDVSH